MSCKDCHDDHCDSGNHCYYRFKVPVPCKKMNCGVPPNGNGIQRVGTIYLASFESLPNGNFIGLGTTSPLANYQRSTVVIPENAIITGLVFSIRNNTLLAGEIATAEIVLSRSCGFGDPISTGIIASVTGPNSAATPNCCGSATANYPINKCDLLSVRVTTGDGALDDGAAATILYTVPA